MTAGKGIIHSEMPQQVAGRMRGFQLWINLPGREKMKPACYQDLEPERIPRVRIGDSEVTVVAGTLDVEGDLAPTTGPIAAAATAAIYFDLAIAPNESLALTLPPGHTVLAYVFEGSARIGGVDVSKGTMARTGDGDRLVVAAGAVPARVLLIGGRPLREPVVHYGPFVMNTRAEIEAAVRDFRAGRLTD
jgi:hypothetical protein